MIQTMTGLPDTFGMAVATKLTLLKMMGGAYIDRSSYTNSYLVIFNNAGNLKLLYTIGQGNQLSCAYTHTKYEHTHKTI